MRAVHLSIFPRRPRRRSRGAIAAAIALALLIPTGGATLVASPAQARSATATVMVTTQRMSDATLQSTQHGTYAQGAKITLSCYKWGQAVKGYYSPYLPNGGYDSLWYKVSDGYYVADVDINTGSNSPVTGQCGSSSPSGSLSARIAAFVSNTRGKTVANAQGTYAGECVSLVSQYLLQVWSITSGAWGNAIDYRSGGSGGNQLSSRGFTWSTSQSFEDGDILVWGESSAGGTGPAGHIGIWYGGKVYDQNDGRHSPARTSNYSPFWSAGFLGRWRKLDKLTSTPTPTISGSTVFGSTLTAKPGTWEPSGVTLAYQWKRNGQNIGGATRSSYQLTTSDIGTKLSVAVTGSKSGYASVTKTSAATDTITKASFQQVSPPAISGTPQVGEALTAAPATWNPAPSTVTRQWYADGTPIAGATGATFTLTRAELGAAITVAESVSKDGYNPGAATSAATAPVAQSQACVAATDAVDAAQHDVTAAKTGLAKAKKAVKKAHAHWKRVRTKKAKRHLETALRHRAAASSHLHAARDRLEAAQQQAAAEC